MFFSLIQLKTHCQLSKSFFITFTHLSCSIIFILMKSPFPSLLTLFCVFWISSFPFCWLLLWFIGHSFLRKCVGGKYLRLFLSNNVCTLLLHSMDSLVRYRMTGKKSFHFRILIALLHSFQHCCWESWIILLPDYLTEPIDFSLRAY